MIDDGTVTADTWNLSGTDAGNYVLAAFGAPTADVTAMAVTVTMNTDTTIVYGQAVVAPGYTSSLFSLYGSDAFTGAPAVDSVATNDLSASGHLKAGTYDIVQEDLNISDGNGGGNYTITFTPAPGAFTVTPKSLGHNVTPVDKIYDGTNVAHCTGGLTAGDVITGDVVQLDSAFTFPGKNVIDDGTVTADTWNLSGADAGNYALAAFGAPTADIGKRDIDITGGTVTPKTYDGNTTATVMDLTFSGLTGGDSLIISTDYMVSAAAFDDAGVATNKTVKVTAALTGTTAAGNYNLTNGTDYSGPSLTGDITSYILTGADLAYDLSSVVYDGSPQGIPAPTLNAPLAGLGDITVKYNGLATVPTNADIYTVTVDVRNIDANHADAADLPLGTFEIAKAVPTAEHLNIAADTYVYYNGDPQSVPAPPLKGPYTGLGVATVKYNGSDRPPVYPGEYAITLDVAAGANFAAITGLPAGRLVISELSYPRIQRKVTLDVSPHFASSIAPGVFHVESGSDLTIVLTPLATLPDGYEVQATTNRVGNTDARGGVRTTLNADGTYTVRVVYIVEETVITIRAVDPSTADELVPATRVWSSGRKVYIATPSTSGQAYVYNIYGQLVNIVSHAAGETVVTQLQEAGIYVVVVEGRSYKIISN